MADIISRLKLESGEFDSKIKRAGQELMAYSEHCRKTGLVMGYANKDAKDFAKGLGNMQTTSTTARGKINELSDAFVNLRVMYKNMTDEEKNNQFGKNLAASLDQLKTRINEAKKDLADVTAELNGAGKVSGGGILDSFLGDKLGGMMSVFGGNLMTKGFEMATGAAMTFVNAIKDAAAQGLEMAKQGEGIRIAFERLNQPGLLDELNNATHGTVTNLELMKAAVKFNDFNLPLSQMGTLLAFAQQKAKDTGQSVDYLVESIVTGLGRQSLMILDNLGLSANEIKERMKETGDMTTAVADIIRDRMQAAGDYVETAADRAAQADKELKDAMEELGRALIPLEQDGVSMWNALEVGAIKLLTNGVNKVTPALLELKDTIGSIYDTITESKAWDYYTTALSTVTSKAAEAIPVLGQLWKLIKSMGGDGTDAAGGAAIGAVLQNIAPDTKKPTKKDGGNSGGNKTAPKDDFVEIVGLIGNAEERVADLQKRIRESWDEGEIAKLTEELKAAEKELKELKDIGKDVDGGQLTEVVVRGNPMVSARKKLREAPTNLQSFGEYSAAITSALKNTDIGSELYTKLSEQLRDTTTVSTLLQEMMERGLAGADLETTAQALKEKLLSPEGIDQTTIQSFLDELNKQIEEAGGVGLKLNADTGEVIDDKDKGKDKGDGEDLKKFNEGIGKLSGGLSQVTGGLKAIGVDIPKEVDQVIGVVNGVSQIISGVGTIISIFGTSAITANTTAVGLNTAAIGGLIAALEFNTMTSFLPFANGGIVGRAAGGMLIPGNSYSGDNLRMPVVGGGMIGVNSGEVILNHAQADVIASELEGGGLQNLNLTAILKGEDIELSLKHRSLRQGRGEYVTTRFK